MIEIQARRSYGFNDIAGDHRVYSIDCGYGKWCDISTGYKNSFVVSYCFKSRRYKQFATLQEAIQFATNWYAIKFPQMILGA